MWSSMKYFLLESDETKIKIVIGKKNVRQKDDGNIEPRDHEILMHAVCQNVKIY